MKGEAMMFPDDDNKKREDERKKREQEGMQDKPGMSDEDMGM